MRIATQKISLSLMGAVAALILATVWLVPIELLPFWLGGIGVITALATYVFLGNPLVAVLAWFLTVTCLHEEFARLILPGFFNLTIPRVLILVVVAMFVGMVAAGRLRIRWAWPTSLLMTVILVYFTLSAAVSGFQTIAVASVHYRLIAGYWFPFLVFALVLHAVHTDIDIRRLLTFFFLLGLYLTFTGWAERFQLWSLVWPSFIADPDKGIHWGRVRGPFLVSPIMGTAMVYVFFNNLVLARMSGPLMRFTCRLAALMTLPVLFWTQTRSVWLAMALAAILWLGFSRRGLVRSVGISLLLAVVIVGGTWNWRNLSSERREVGGMTSIEPIYVRLGLALITWDIFKDHPLTGVGFGHFRDHAVRYAHNPSSPYYAFASTAMEHNNFLSLLAECGLVGLVLFVWLLVAMLRASLRVYRRLPTEAADPINRDLVLLYWILYANWLVDAMFRETSVSPFVNSLLFGMTAMIFALDYLLSAKPIEQPFAVDHDSAPRLISSTTPA